MNEYPTQCQTVLRLLRERGEAGITAIELDRAFGIYRAGARVFELRRAGHTILTENHHGKTARYRLIEKPVQLAAFEEAS